MGYAIQLCNGIVVSILAYPFRLTYYLAGRQVTVSHRFPRAIAPTPGPLNEPCVTLDVCFGAKTIICV